MLEHLSIAGAATAVLGFVLAMVKLAISAHKQRADDWRTSAQTSAEANMVLTGHFDKLIAISEQLAASQREMFSLLQSMAAELRTRQ